jgi:hypothetical protein
MSSLPIEEYYVRFEVFTAVTTRRNNPEDTILNSIFVGPSWASVCRCDISSPMSIQVFETELQLNIVDTQFKI